MTHTIRATFALLVAVTIGLMGCGGDPGSSGDNSGDTNPSGSTGSGTTPHMVTIPVTLVAGDATDAVASLAAVNIWRNDPANPMGTMPISYEAYVTNPVVVDANDPSLDGIGVDVIVDGYVTTTAPHDVLLVADLKAAADVIPVNAIVACDLTGAAWSCTTTQKSNGGVVNTSSETSTITMSIDLEHGSWHASACGIGFGLLGDTVQDTDSQAMLSGTVSGHMIDVAREGSPGNGFYCHCER